MFDLIAIGDSTLDTFLVLDEHSKSCGIDKKKYKLCLNYADKIAIAHSTQSVGGDAANVSVGMRKLGLKTAIITELGDDINGAIVEHELSKAGVDTQLVKKIKNKETRYSVVLNFQAERTILSYHAPRAYTLPQLPETKWIYYTSLGKSFEKLQQSLEKHLHNHSEIQIAINPGSYQLHNGMTHIQRLFPRTEILFLNKEEANALAGKKKNIRASMKAIHAQGVRIVVITDSFNGSYVSNNKNMWFMPVYPIIPIAKTGAGDAYASGFLSAIIHDKNIPTAMQWGTANAASVIQKFGAQTGLTTPASLKKILRAFQKYFPHPLPK